MNKSIVRSPFFYVGDKYKLMPQLQLLFPDNISTYVEPFVGGGSSFLNTKAPKYIVNDLDYYVIKLHKELSSYARKPKKLFELLFSIIEKYGFSCSYQNITVPNDLKKKYVKTYYSHYNKDAYSRLKADFNKNHDYILLYILLIYGFNHMIRFNSSGIFNLPVGNVDFNKNVYNALENYLKFMAESEVVFSNMNYLEFVDSVELDSNSFVYFDPPYLISGSEYNKYWSVEDDKTLYDCLDELDRRGIRFGITNLISHKGRVNDYFYNWTQKYCVYSINSNYISFNDNTVKEDSREVYVTNYGKYN